MRTLLLAFIVFAVSGLTSCGKCDYEKKCGDEYEKDKRHKKGVLHKFVKGKKGVKKDKDKKVEKDDKYKGKYKEYIYEDLVFSEECQCIVAGKVKYVGVCGTEALVDYGTGECDNIALKTVCIDGDCEHPEAYTVEFEVECEEATTLDNSNPVTESNATKIGKG